MRRALRAAARLGSVPVSMGVLLTACSPAKDSPPTAEVDAGAAAVERSPKSIHQGRTAYHQLRFLQDRVALARGGRESLVGLTSFGRGDRVAPAPVSSTSREAATGRVTYARGAVDEWFVERAEGLEQGFTVHTRPSGEGRLRLVVGTDGAFRVDALGLALHGPDGAFVSHVSRLSAFDATGRSMPSTMAPCGASLCIDVDDVGATYPLIVDPVYSVESKLRPADASPGARFGQSASISGDVLAVGTSAQAAYVYARVGTTWTEQAKLTVPSPDAELGNHVSASGASILVSSPGAPYVFVRSGTTWSEQAKLSVAGVTAAHGFTKGAIDGDLVVVGAPGWDEPVLGDDPTSSIDSGAAYVFARSGASWSLEAKLVASDARDLDRFGEAVAVSGDTVAVTSFGTTPARRAVYVFVRAGGTWSQQARLAVADALTEDELGRRVALDGDRLAVSAQGRSEGVPGSGAVYAFARTGATWSSPTKLRPTVPVPGGAFGASLALRGERLLVGTTKDEAHVYRAAGTSWSHELVVQPSDGDGIPKMFGVSAALDGDAVAVGADRDGPTIGSVYAYSLLATKEPGGACARNAECSSGFCVDGVCCDTPCSEACVACTAAKKGSGVDGACGPVAEDTDPDDDCAPDPGYPTSCKDDGLCDGAGHCRVYAKAGVTCGAPTCLDGKVTARACNGAGGCDATATACAPYACDATACKASCASDGDCAGDAFCSSGVCVAKGRNGDACAAAKECTSGFCADGVCCDAACTGQCEACNVPASEGTCIPVVGAPRGSRPACKGDPAICGGACDGASRSKCEYAPATKACGSTCADGKETRSTCDGLGACVDGAPRSCGAYACESGACLTSCSSDASCATGYRCDGASCVPAASAACSDDGTQSVGVDGKITPCGAYRCDQASGTCRQLCTASEECAAGNVCNAATKSCEPVAAAAGDDGGGCSVRGPGAAPGGVAAAALALVAVALRRRRVRAAR